MIVRALMMVALMAAALQAQEVGLTASADKKELRLGEPVVVMVTARLSVEVDSIGPLAADSLGLFEVLSVRQEEDDEWSFELMTIDTGKVFLPPIAFGYVRKGDTTHQTAYANSLFFSVAGVDIGEGADIKDIKAPMAAPWKWEDIWPYLLVVLLVGAGWFVYRKYFRKKAGPEREPEYIAPPVAPHVTALRELRELEEKKLWQQGMMKEYYTGCTEIIRRFFEARFGFPALEMTSDETLDHLRGKHIDAKDLAPLREFFVRADMVKFAKGSPSPDEHQRELSIAYEVVRSMAERPPEPEEKKYEEVTLAG